MAHPRRVHAQAVLLALSLLSPAAWPESTVARNRPSASARVTIRVTVPPVVNLLENSHPSTLAAGSGPITALQRIVLHTNVRQGACVELTRRVPGASSAAWELRAVGGEAVSLQAHGDGWRLCTLRQGTYAVQIEHRFGAEFAGRWPLRTDTVLL